MYKKVEIVPYHSSWVEQYESEAKKIKECLQDNLITIYHIGSTSIPYLSAKPKIDMIAELVDPKKAIPALATIDIEYRGEYNIPFHYGFRKRGTVDINLHVYEKNNPEVELNLLFKEYLMHHPEARIEYQKLKEKILKDDSAHVRKENAQFVSYTLRKGDFIRKILEKAGFRRIRMLRCSDDGEWRTAKMLRKQFFDKKGVKENRDKSIFYEKNQEHFLLYQGTKIIGYAHVVLSLNRKALIPVIVMCETNQGENHEKKFMELIQKWLLMQGYQYSKESG